MPRTVTPTIDARLDAQGTTPLWLVMLDIDTTPYYVSGMETAVTGGVTWTPGALKISPEPSQKSGATLEATIQVAQGFTGASGTIRASCLADMPHDKDADIYVCYWDGAAYSTPQLILEGTIIGARFRNGGRTSGVPMMEFRVSSKTATKGGSVPFVRLSPPFLTSISVKGSRFSWGSQIVELA